MPEDDFPGVSQRPLGHYGHAALSSGEQTLISPEKPSKMALIGRQTMVLGHQKLSWPKSGCFCANYNHFGGMTAIIYF